MHEPDEADLELLATYKQALKLLQIQQAKLGALCPPGILMDIAENEAKIAELEAQLGLAAPPETRSNLPRLPFFFGRSDELAQIAAELAPEARGWGMLIDGAGGIGKTALAIHAAELVSPTQFPLKLFISAKVRELRADGSAFMLPALAAAFVRRRLPAQAAERGARLAEYVAALVEANGYEQYARFTALEAAWSLIAAALPLLLEGEHARLQTFCGGIDTFLEFSGRWDAGLQLSETAEARAIVAGAFYTAGWRAYQAGMSYYLRGQAEPVLAAAQRATEHWRQAGVGVREQSIALRLQGLGYQLQENYPAASAAYQQVVELHRSLNPENEDVAIALNSLAGAKRMSGEFAGAERDYHEALRIAQNVGDQEGVAIYTGNLAGLALNRAEWVEAETLARAALRRAEAIGWQELIAANCGRIAQALARQGKLQEGIPFARHAVELYTRLGSPQLAWAQQVLAECEGGEK